MKSPKKVENPECSPVKTQGFQDNQKIALNPDVMNVVNEIVKSIDKLLEAVHDAQNNQYGAALAAVLAIIQSLFDTQVVPRIKKA